MGRHDPISIRPAFNPRCIERGAHNCGSEIRSASTKSGGNSVESRGNESAKDRNTMGLKQGAKRLLQVFVGHVPDGICLPVLRIGDDAGSRVYMRGIHCRFRKSFLDKPAGEYFSEAEQLVL